MKIGLKVWASNKAYIKDAKKFIADGVCDFIEIYVNAECQAQDSLDWKGVSSKICLHAPHSYGGFNPGQPGLEKEKRAALEKVDVFRRELNPGYIIFHPGIEGAVEETIRQYKVYKKDFPEVFALALIENKPKIGIGKEVCLGSSPAEIRQIQEQLGFGFCLDVSHVICYAAWLKTPWRNILEEFFKFKPQMVHLCDGYVDSVKDTHLHLGRGNYDLRVVLEKVAENQWATLETPHDFSDKLDDFQQDVVFLRKMMA